MYTCVVVRRAAVAMCLLAVPVLAGCQTIAGFGRDVQHAGRLISGGAEGTEAWVFGPQDQPAQAQNTNGSMSGNAARVSDARDNVVYFATGSADISPDLMREIRSIATASLNNSDISSGNASLQGADKSSMQNSGANSGQIADNGLGQNAGNLSEQNARRFAVIGYTDTAGSAAYNRTLSQRRAEAVTDALVAQGVPRDSIDVQWYGEDELPVPTADGVAEAENRRVSIAMTGG